MSVNPVALIEMLFSFSVPLAWGLCELHKLRRERRKDAEIEAAKKRESDA